VFLEENLLWSAWVSPAILLPTKIAQVNRLV